MKSSYFSKDVREFLFLLYKHEVEYLIVGGEAVIYYGHARLTGDIDIFYQLSDENAERLYKALEEFWGETIPGLKNKKDLMQKGWIIQFGVPPNRIDLLNTIEGISFQEAWRNKKTEYIVFKKQKTPVYYIGLRELIKNKEKVQRPKDLEDLKYLYQKLKDSSGKEK